MCFFNRGKFKGTNSWKFVSDICVCMFCFMFAKCLVLWTDLTKGLYIYMRWVLKCAFAYDQSLTVLRWPCVVDRTLKSSYLLTFTHIIWFLSVISFVPVSLVCSVTAYYCLASFCLHRLVWHVLFSWWFCLRFAGSRLARCVPTVWTA